MPTQCEGARARLEEEERVKAHPQCVGQGVGWRPGRLASYCLDMFCPAFTDNLNRLDSLGLQYPGAHAGLDAGICLFHVAVSGRHCRRRLMIALWHVQVMRSHVEQVAVFVSVCSLCDHAGMCSARC